MMMYRVGRILSPWLAGVGDLTGLPVSLVELSPSGGEMTLHDIAADINALNRRGSVAAPLWTLIRGDESQVDNDLLVALRVLTRTNMVAEVSGAKPLGSQHDRTPMFDHVAVRTVAPSASVPVYKVQRIDSFVLRGPLESTKPLAAISATLDKRGFQGRRYVEAEDEPTLHQVVAFGRGWRVTRPVLKESACREVV